MVQLLEGNEDTIVSLFNKIKQDPRHEDLHIIMMQTVLRRHYTMFQRMDMNQYAHQTSTGESEIR